MDLSFTNQRLENQVDDLTQQVQSLTHQLTQLQQTKEKEILKVAN